MSTQHRCPAGACFDTQAQAKLLYCGSWTCRYCAKRNANKWAKRAELGFQATAEDENPEMWFMTLTLGSYYHTALDGFKAIPELWDTTRKQYQRYYGGWMYLAFVEGQPERDNMPHFHVLTPVEPPTRRGRKGYVTKHGLHDWAVSVGWGFQADLQLVASKEACIYVSKYASKSSSSTPKGFRRVRVSQNWPALPDQMDYPYLVPARDEDIAHYLMRVSEVTGVEEEELAYRWSAIQEKLQDERER